MRGEQVANCPPPPPQKKKSPHFNTSYIYAGSGTPTPMTPPPLPRPTPQIGHCIILRPKKNVYVALSRPTVKCEKQGQVFFFFFLCQIWAKNLLKFVFNGLKKHLYMRFDCIPPEFSPFRNFKKKIGKLNSLTVR